MPKPGEDIAPRFHYAWFVLGVGTLSVFAALGLARFGYTMLLPPMQAELGLDNTQAGALATANLTGYLILSALGGALAAHFGPRRVIAAGLAVAAVGMGLTGLAEGFGAAVAWRALTGLGSGAANVGTMGLMSAWFAPRRRGITAGVAVTGSSLALIILGPTVPRLLASPRGDGWRWCWYLFAAASLALAVLALAVLRNRPGDVGLRALGTTAREEAAAAAAPAARWASVYGSPAVWLLGAVYVAFGFSYIIYMTFFTKHLIASGGYSQPEAGRLFMLMGWLSLACGVLWGWVSDAIGRKGALMIVYGIHAVSFGLFALWPTPAGFTLSAVLFGLSAWSIPAIMAATCGDVLGARLAPAGLGFVTLFFGIGQAAGPSVAGALADATGSFSSAFLLASGVALAGVALASLLPARRGG